MCARCFMQHQSVYPHIMTAATESHLYDKVFVGNFASMCVKKQLACGQDCPPARGILPPMRPMQIHRLHTHNRSTVSESQTSLTSMVGIKLECRWQTNSAGVRGKGKAQKRSQQ